MGAMAKERDEPIPCHRHRHATMTFTKTFLIIGRRRVSYIRVGGDRNRVAVGVE